MRCDKEFFEFKGSNDHTAPEFRKVIFGSGTDAFDQAMNTEAFLGSKKGRCTFREVKV